MKTDRELLELSAKATGMGYVPEHAWNPLKYDVDALRLAVKLNMQVTISPCYCDAYSPDHDIGVSENNADTYAATRRAIVRAAAAIGESL